MFSMAADDPTQDERRPLLPVAASHVWATSEPAHSSVDKTADGGFTLIEIVVSIVLIGILAAVAVVGISRLTGKATAASCAASADAARTAVNAYLVNRTVYPTSMTELTASIAGVAPFLAVPPGASVSDRDLVTGGWTLTMSASVPPTFTCLTTATTNTSVTASTTSTSTTSTSTTSTSTTSTTAVVAPTTVGTTATTAQNGVSATSRLGGDQRYYGEHVITLTNASSISDLTVTISIAQTPGLTYLGQYTTFWTGAMTGSHDTSPAAVSYTFSIVPGQTIVPGTWTLGAQTGGTGTVHPTTGDTWRVTSTTPAGTTTLTGTF